MRSLLVLALLALLAAAPALAQQPASGSHAEAASVHPTITVEHGPAQPPAPKKEISRHYNIAPTGDTQGRRCELQVGPKDRLAQEGDLVIRRGEVVDAAFALRGGVTVEAGATVTSAVALGGPVTVDGRASEDVVAIRGDVVVRDGGRVEGDALAIAGRVRVEAGGQVAGDVTSLGPGFLVGDLADVALKELERRGPCVVKIDPAAAGAPAGK